MKELVIILLFLVQGPFLFAQQGKRYIKKGNDLYKQQNYAEAEASYRKSVTPKSQSTEGNFNLGDALYKQKKFADAREQFSQIAGSANNSPAVKAQAYHNLGNSFVTDKKLEEGIAAYKKALINNPKDEETRYNLAYAQEMLKKQQQQKKDKNKDQKNKDNKKNQDNKDQNKDKKDQDKDKKDQQNKDQNDQKQEPKPQPGQLSKEDAQSMLDAMNNNEKQTQDKLKNKKFKGEKARVAKDW
ncbi:Tetratricopeptide repeat-containing protein [Pedobacter hartonius]|uniref:Tetratricopeptide repeat-containing protein n=2 Tax=Pedobacter hartonius TaxID=425514 RepID=A0A1H4G814_9SPHI|nr:Tetratricopeptide repeat-containing protein [Pedobacter hartonius]